MKIKLPSGETETYLITLPKLVIEGLWLGRPYVELAETSYIQASHGLTSTIKYSGKGWLSGTSHSHTTTISAGPASTPLYTLDGTWVGETKFAKHSKANVGQVFLDAGVEGIRKPVDVQPVEQQNEYESRRAWKAVADGIRKGDFDSASTAKTTLENAQRQKRKDEAAAGAPFQLRLFDKVVNDPEYKRLAGMIKFKPEEEDSYVFKGRQ